MRYRSENGFSLVEIVIAMAVGALVVLAGTRFLSKLGEQTKKQQSFDEANSEISLFFEQLAAQWQTRLQRPNIGVPSQGFRMLDRNNQPCLSNCSRLDVYVKTTINQVSYIDTVSFTNSCKLATNTPISDILAQLSIATSLASSCRPCPGNQLPSLEVVSVLRDRNNNLRQDSVRGVISRLFPSTLKTPEKLDIDSLIGFQACFSSSGASQPIEVDMRALRLTQDEKLQVQRDRKNLAFSSFGSVGSASYSLERESQP